ncbi:MAG: GNAT family N-acetyltransferase [Blastocatellia bacterium]
MNTRRHKQSATPPPGRQKAPALAVRLLGERDREAAIALLSSCPQRGVHLKSMIMDHGMCAPALRGRFHGYFADGRLTGLALVGHQIMFCAPDHALPALARAAAASGLASTVIFGPAEQVALFWDEFAATGRAAKLSRDFYWYVCEQPAQPHGEFMLTEATPAELDAVVEAHASMFIEATGADPRDRDPEGFRQRALDRIHRGRTWIRVADGRVIFKIELQSVTPDAVYLEGVWTHPEYRGHGVAREGVVEMAHRRLGKQQLICLVVEPEEKSAQAIYEYAGFSHDGDYRAVYLQPVA